MRRFGSQRSPIGLVTAEVGYNGNLKQKRMKDSAVMSVILTGFMGTGKTTVGRLLAARTGRTFVDTDEIIEQRAGKTIARIFAEDGADAFRRMEREIAKELAGRQGLVIGTGGRLMLDPQNEAALGPENVVMCLTAQPEEIVERLDDDAVRRPLLEVAEPAARVKALLTERAAKYERFPQVSTSGRPPKEVVAEIVGRFPEVAYAASPAAAPERLAVRHPSGRYDVVVGRSVLSRLRKRAGLDDAPVAVVTDSTVGPLYATEVGQALTVVTMPAGEQHKRLETVRNIYDQLLAAGLDRTGAVVALGGGVVGDVAGFVAATYMRGIPLVQCPTTLLAMVDASVGGKTGVDLPQGKNLVGAFKQPAAVLADVGTLRTLPPAEFAAGMAEVVKHGLLTGGALLQRLEQDTWGAAPIAEKGGPAALQTLIAEAIQVKRDVVEEDPFEEGVRATLNLGHTFAHAIEQVSGYAIRHGEAVAIGLVAAAHLSAALGYCNSALQWRIERMLTRFWLPTRIPPELSPHDLLLAMGSDKKRAGGRLRFILIREPGDVFVTASAPESAVLDTLAALRKKVQAGSRSER